MPESSKEIELNNLDDKDKTPKSSLTNGTETKITSIKDDCRRRYCDSFNLEENNMVGESSSKSCIENDKIQSADSAATTSNDLKPPVSVCFKKTSEVVSKESYVSMLEDINLFFSNLKELESRRTAKRKLNSALEDINEKSNLSHSKEWVQPAKKLLLETSTNEAISPTSELDQPVADVTPASPENVNSTLPNIASEDLKNKHLNTSDTNHSNGCHSSTSSCQTVTSSEDLSSIPDQPNSDYLPMDTDVPERIRNEETLAVSQPAIEDEPVEHVIMEGYGQAMPEVNGVTKHHFPGIFEVQIILPLFEYLLNDLLELRSFLDGQPLPPSRLAEETIPSEITPLDRQLASIMEEFGTGVESPVAEITREALIEWESRNFPAEDSEQDTSDPESQSDHTEDSSPESSIHRIDSEPNSSKTPESTENQSPDPEPMPSCSKSDVKTNPTKSPQNPETSSSLEKEDHSPTEKLVQNTESVLSFTKAITETPSKPTCTDVVPLTDTIRLNAEIDLLMNPSDIASLLRALNRIGIKYFNSCVETVKSILSACLVHGVYFFNRNLVDHMFKIVNLMRRLVALRQECSEMLKKCSDRNSDAGVIYILKVKTHVARSYNQLLVKILAINNNFHDMVKERLPSDLDSAI